MERYPGQRAGYISWQVGSFLTLLVVPLLFLPKINLVAVAGENAGLRIDDFVLAIALCTVIASFLLCRRAWITKQEIFLTLFMGLGAVSAIFNGTSILYALRLLEYFTLFYVGLHARRWLSLRSIVLAFLYLNFVLIFLQAIRVIGSFPLGEYKVGVPIGIGSGNWEIGLLLNICIATLAFGGFPQRRMVLPHMLITMAALFIVGSRTPAVSCLALVLLYLTRKHLTNRGGLIAIAATVVILAGAGWGAADELANSSLVRRVAPLLTTDYGAAIDDVWRSTEPRDQYVDETEAYEILMQSGATYDLSLIIRGAKVIGALKYFSNRGPLEWLIGTGPGRYGAAMDCGGVWLIVENGIIGFALFFYWLSACLRYCPAKWYLIGLFCVSMFTLDTYLAYKIMAFLLFVAGYYASGKNVWEPARHDRAALAALISPNKIVAADQQARAF